MYVNIKRACRHQFAANSTRGCSTVPATGRVANGPACCPGGLGAPISRPTAEELAGLLKAVADPARLQILALLRSKPNCEACVCDVTDVSLSQPTVSHHLKVLVGRTRQHREARTGRGTEFCRPTDRTVDGARVTFADLTLDAASAMSGQPAQWVRDASGERRIERRTNEHLSRLSPTVQVRIPGARRRSRRPRRAVKFFAPRSGGSVRRSCLSSLRLFSGWRLRFRCCFWTHRCPLPPWWGRWCPGSASPAGR